MVMRIRRAALMVALTLLMATSLAGVAWAANVIRCAPRIVVPFCEGTGKNDVMYGTNKADWIGGGQYGADTLYGRDGDDELVGGVGPDTIRGGPGDDYITNGDNDYWFGEDENHGGRGNDSIVGNLMSEKHFGARGDDYLGDYKSIERPDTFRCGSGLDQAHYNKGIDKVAADCEKLWAAGPRYVTPY